MNLAIIHFAPLRDTIISTFVSQFIKAKLPHATITWVTSEAGAPIFKDNKDINQIITLPYARFTPFSLLFGRDKKQLKKCGTFDAAVDLQGSLPSALTARGLSKNSSGFDRISTGSRLISLWYKKRFYLPPQMMTCDRYRLLCAKALDIEITKKEVLHKQPCISAGKTPAVFKSRRGKAVFIIGGEPPNVRYGADNFLALARGLDMDIFIPYRSDEEYNIASYLAEYGPNCRVLPRTDLAELGSIIAKADLVVGNDCAYSYLGWAANRPTVILYGPTAAGRVYDDTLCRCIQSGSAPASGKVDENDRSIGKIPTRDVYKTIKELLGR